MYTQQKIDELREGLIGCLHKDPRTMKSFAAQLGLATLSVDRFLRGETTPNLKTLLIIENYLKKEK